MIVLKTLYDRENVKGDFIIATINGTRYEVQLTKLLERRWIVSLPSLGLAFTCSNPANCESDLTYLGLSQVEIIGVQSILRRMS